MLCIFLTAEEFSQYFMTILMLAASQLTGTAIMLMAYCWEAKSNACTCVIDNRVMPYKWLSLGYVVINSCVYKKPFFVIIKYWRAR